MLGDDSGLESYLYEKPGNGDTEPNPIFNDLTGDYDKTEGGQTRGIGQLRLKADAYFKELAKQEAFKHLGRNADARAEALADDPVANALHRLDRQLNKFYVGNDADYFIHKDLKGFLTREKDRFIKNVIFSDLGTLLNAAQDTTTVIIARAFNDVAKRIIDFLDAIETFQRGLFTLKKKVVDTHYLISVGKIPERFWPRIIQNRAQAQEWKSSFRIDLAEPAQLADHQTLVVDTRHFMATDKALKDEIVGDSAFDNLDEKTNGLLIVSENWQALSLLRTKYAQRVTCVYNDPPYNTGKDEFLYKDSFRHSSWASFIFDRYSMLGDLLSENGIIFTSIDKNELQTLLPIERKIFGEANDIGKIVWRNARDNNPTRIAIEHEYVTCFAKSSENTEAIWKNEITSGKELLLDEYNRLKSQGLHVADIQRELRSFIRNNLPLLKEVDRYKFVDEEGVYTDSQSVHNPHKGGVRIRNHTSGNQPAYGKSGKRISLSMGNYEEGLH